MKKFNEIKITKEYSTYTTPSGVLVRNKFNLDVLKIHKELNQISFTKEYESIGGKNCINEALENYKLPPIVYVYYYLFAKNCSIPSVNSVCKYYIELFCEEVSLNTYQLKKEYINYKNISFNENELKARILRAYNSFNREIELLANLIKEHGNEVNFYYSFHKDYYEGIDIVALKDNHEISIATYFSSKRSKDFRAEKEDHRHDYSKTNLISLLAYFSGEEKNVNNIGDVKVYDKKAVETVYKQILLLTK